jgi:hypothetical protein
MFPTKIRFIWPSSFRGEDLKKSANQKQELLTDWDKISNLYRGSLIGAFYQVLLHLAKRLRNLVGSILGKFSIKIAHLVPFR